MVWQRPDIDDFWPDLFLIFVSGSRDATIDDRLKQIYSISQVAAMTLGLFVA